MSHTLESREAALEHLATTPDAMVIVAALHHADAVRITRELAMLVTDRADVEAFEIRLGRCEIHHRGSRGRLAVVSRRTERLGLRPTAELPW